MNWPLLVKAAAVVFTASIAFGALRRYLRRGPGRGGWSLVVLCCCLNFLAFWLIGASIGGGAQLGRITGGRYFLGDHGRLTEVSAWVYWYSWVHTASQAVTFPLWIVGEVILHNREKVAEPTDLNLRGRGAV